MVKGYKVFDAEWRCKGKQYTCPGRFEEDGEPCVCSTGMHFCKNAADCFNYYGFNPKNKVAEVIAYGEVVEDGDKCCTNELEIVREIPWNELLQIVNMGKGCTGFRNSGDRNSGDWNSGNRNSGNLNSGDCNSGNLNSGDCNSGNRNIGDWNSGNKNSGNHNSGNCNIGYWNSGNANIGNYNSGNRNWGNFNSGDWNKVDYSSGCFNTEEQKIYLFNRPSDWTYSDWLESGAKSLLSHMPTPYHDPTAPVIWWHGLPESSKGIIKAIPNFDREIFKEITGIDVE